jgi:hypothetical protein
MSDLQAENRRIATIAYERIRLSIRRDMDDYQLLLSSGPDYCYLFKDKELRDKFGTYLLRIISNNILKLNIKEEIK